MIIRPNFVTTGVDSSSSCLRLALILAGGGLVMGVVGVVFEMETPSSWEVLEPSAVVVIGSVVAMNDVVEVIDLGGDESDEIVVELSVGLDIVGCKTLV